MNKYEELKNKINEEIKSIEGSKSRLNELIEEVKKAEQEERSNNEIPFKIGEKYYYIATAEEIAFNKWVNDSIDIWRFNQGNTFKTEKDAEDKLFQLRLEGKARKFKRINNCDVTGEDLRNVDNNKYYVYYNLVRGIRISFNNVTIEQTKLGYFKTKQMAEKFIKENKEDLIKYFEIEMGD